MIMIDSAVGPVVLRAFTPGDRDSLALHANNRNVWLGVRDVFPYPYTVADAERFIAYAAKTENEKIFAVDLGGEVIGAAGLHLKHDVRRLNGEIGYWLGPAYHNRGIATRIVSHLVTMAFDEYGLLRVYAEVFANNPASGRVLEKNGFALEARLKQAIIKDGAVLDLLIYAKINSEWSMQG